VHLALQIIGLDPILEIAAVVAKNPFRRSMEFNEVQGNETRALDPSDRRC